MQELDSVVSSITEAIKALQTKIASAGYKLTMPVSVSVSEDNAQQRDGWDSEEGRTVSVTPEPNMLKGMVPAFADALKDAGFVMPTADTTPLEPIPEDVKDAFSARKAVLEATKVESLGDFDTLVTFDALTPVPAPVVEAVPAVSELYLKRMDELAAMLEKYKEKRDEFCKAARGLVPGMDSKNLKAYYSQQRKARMAAGTWPKPLTPTQRKKLVKSEPRPSIEEIIATQANGLTATPEPVPTPEAVNGYTEPAIPVVKDIPTFNEQVQAMRAAEVAKAMDPKLAAIEGQVAQDAAGNKHNSLLQLARTTARALGANGPISVDEVTAAMAATSNVLPSKGKVHSWKGKIFASNEWVCVGNKATSMVSSHARHVGVWALKSWLAAGNTLNGTAASVSSYNLFGIYKDMSRLNTTRIKTEAERFSWFIGDENLSPELRATIVKDNNAMYGIPVSFIPGAVGALLMPPDPSKGLARAEK